jgi:flagellar motor protein MotB
MKTLVAVPAFVALLASVMLTGGCVDQAKYDEAVAAARRANDQLAGVMDALEKLKKDNKDLQAQLAEKDAALSAESQKYALTKDELAKARDEFNRLNEKYLALLNQPKPPTEMPLPDDLNKALKDLADANGWTYDATRGVVRLSSDLTFEKGKDDVRPGPKAALEKFARIMNSASASPFYVYVAGHTDDIPIRQGTATFKRHPDNWYLSVHRAISVEQVLSGAGLKDTRIGAMGYGENYPIVPNAAGHRGSSTNRRVELWVVPEAKFLVLPMSEGGKTETTVPETTATPSKHHGRTAPASKPAAEEEAPE